MKKSLIKLSLIIQFSALTIHADPISKYPSIGLLKNKVINQIKHEKPQPNQHTSNLIFDENQLNEMVQMRLLEQSELFHARDMKTFEKAVHFMSLALKAWNPELRNLDIKMQIKMNIVQFGAKDGFIIPAMALMDSAYSIERNNFGSLINVMLNEITPVTAQVFKYNFGIPTDFNGQTFLQISHGGHDKMWNILINELGPDSFVLHNKVVKLEVDNGYTPTTMDIFLEKTVKAPSSFKESYMRTSGSPNITKSVSKKPGVFSKESNRDTASCTSRCYQEIRDVAYVTVPAGFLAGTKIGAVFGAGAAAGGVIGGSAGVGAAVYVGYNECQQSKQCGGEGSENDKIEAREAEAKVREAEANAEAAEARANEAKVKVKEAETKVKESEQRVKEAEAKVREAEAKAKEAEVNATAAEVKLRETEEKLKKAKESEKKLAQENFEKAKKEKQAADKKAAEAKQASEEAQEKAKKEKEEDDKRKKELEQSEEELSKNTKSEKPMLSDDEIPKKLTEEELEERKKYNSTPKAPPEDGGGNNANPFDLDSIIKKIESEKAVQQPKASVIYPTNPNAKD